MSEPAKSDHAASSNDVPIVSIGMPIFNAGRYLRKAVLSILQQTLSQWELIIIDDASTDGALDSIQDLHDPRIRIVRGTENRGLAARLNEAVGLARGRYFARMDQDDISHPERLARQLAFLESHPEVDVVGARCLLIDGDDRVSGVLEFPEHHDEVCRRPWRGILMPHPTWMGKTEWFRNNSYRSPGPYFCEDQELLLRAHRTARFAVLPESLLAYRVRGAVPPAKAFRTRVTLAALQCRHFFRHGEPQNALKTAGVFIGKCVHDWTAPLAGRPARSAHAGVALVGMTENERLCWQTTLPDLSVETANHAASAEQRLLGPAKAQSQAKEADEQLGFASMFLRPRTFWLLAFIFCCLQALMVQKLVLPLIPSLHAGHGLLINDAIIFHEVASEAANRIRSVGWSEWSLYPPGFTGNVGVLAALYAVFGPEPAVFIPLNAAAHVTGALMLYLIGPLLWPGRVGRIGGLVAAVLFVIFPSTLLWYSQNHKDAFAIAGTLVMLYGWLRVISTPPATRVDWRGLLLAAGGASLVLMFRPYLSVLAGGAFIFSWLAVLTYTTLRKSASAYSFSAFSFLAIVVVAAAIGASLPASETALKVSFSGEKSGEKAWIWKPSGSFFGTVKTTPPAVSFSADEAWEWKLVQVFPRFIEAPFKRISEIRAHFIAYGQSIGAGSGVDQDQAPNNLWAALRYLPRAFLVGSLSPYPTSWTERVSVPRLTAAGETFLWYCFVAGLAVLIYRRPSAALIGGLFFSAFIITIFSYTSPNVGTLYRVRFGCWMFLLLGGAIGWTSLLLPFLHRLSEAADKTSQLSSTDTYLSKASGGISGLAAAGAVAMAITFMGFLGFLARDLLLINLRGLGGTLDAFFAAVMLPMVFVTCLVMPMADVVTKPFMSGYHAQNPLRSPDIIARFLGVGVLVAVAAVAVTVLAAPQAIRMLTACESEEIIYQGALYLRLFTPIIFLSVWTVLGNSVLNSLDKSAQAAGAQLIVPVCAVSAIILAKPEHALLAGIYGMLFGTALNAAIVLLVCRRLGILLWPSWVRGAFPGDSLSSYCWLAFAAVFTALLVPLNYYFASTVGEGSVSAWAFASKIIILFNGLFAFGVTAVVLPHLARKFNRQQNAAGRNHLYFLLVAGTWVGGFIALALSIFAEPLVYALLSTGDKITEEQIVTLARVLRLGALQVPVAITGAIALKSAAVSGAVVRAVLASFCGLVVNLLLNRMLVPIYGLEGIALGSLGALMVSTALLCAGLRSRFGMSLLLGTVLIVSWLVWVGAAWAVEIHSGVGIMAASGALVVLVFLQWLFWSHQLHHRRSLRHRDVLSQ